jgi:hypothetical protein
MAVRFKNDVNLILICAVIGALILAIAEAGIVFWRLLDAWFGPF